MKKLLCAITLALLFMLVSISFTSPIKAAPKSGGHTVPGGRACNCSPFEGEVCFNDNGEEIQIPCQ